MAKPKRASLGVALIARDAEQTIGHCIRSLRPFVEQVVVCVDESTTDRTAKVARRAGADLVPSIRVSDWHECARHGRVRAQHFARARNESFTYLDKSLGWWMWLDSDDVVKGAEHLAEVCAMMEQEEGRIAAQGQTLAGAWCNYHYSTMLGGRVTNTLFDRERILRTKVGWEWEYRVHEVVKPLCPRPAWLSIPQVQVFHQEGVHKPESSAKRNLLLLEIDLEEDPEDARAAFYMGNQHFAMGGWREAIRWYERLLEIGQNTYEKWQSAVYLSMAYERLGDLDAAINAALEAIKEQPKHPEPYYRLAACYVLSAEFEKAEWWTRMGREREAPPFFVFKNPLDYTFNQRVVLSDALAQMGRVQEAKAELEAAHAAYPDERVGNAIAHYREMEANAGKANAYVTLAHTLGSDWAIENGPRLPAEVRAFGRVRDVYVPALLRARPNTQPRIVFWCGRSIEEWYPETLEETGIGGSETAVIKVAERFAGDGWRVDVYNGAGRYEGLYEGVGYWDPERLAGGGEVGTVFVSWRQPGAHPRGMEAGAGILWCHDLNYGPDVAADMQLWDRVLGVSAWHADMLRRFYTLPAEMVDFVPNGIDLGRFGPDTRKVPFRCVYASSPDRGLERLLRLWPRIVEQEPAAELHVAYGWTVFDAMAQTRPWMAAYKRRITDLLEHTPGVVWRDRLPQAELARLYSESYVWAYPSSFLEVSCISAMEAMAGGAVPVCSASGALKETVGTAGAVVTGHPDSRAWPDFYVNVLRGVLTDPGIRKPLEYAGRERAKEYTWDSAYERWRGIVTGLLEGKKEMVAA